MNRLFITATVRIDLGFTLKDEVTFSEYVKHNETPLECARRRAGELYPDNDMELTTVRVNEIIENQYTGNQTTVKRYYL